MSRIARWQVTEILKIFSQNTKWEKVPTKVFYEIKKNPDRAEKLFRKFLKEVSS